MPRPVRALEFSLARRVRLSHAASVCSFSTPRLKLLLLLLIVLTSYSQDSSGFPRRHPTYTVNRHRASPELIGSRNCVRMAFTAESPQAQGQ